MNKDTFRMLLLCLFASVFSVALIAYARWDLATSIQLYGPQFGPHIIEVFMNTAILMIAASAISLWLASHVSEWVYTQQTRRRRSA